jgi:hypothetical protein
MDLSSDQFAGQRGWSTTHDVCSLKLTQTIISIPIRRHQSATAAPACDFLLARKGSGVARRVRIVSIADRGV